MQLQLTGDTPLTVHLFDGGCVEPRTAASGPTRRGQDVLVSPGDVLHVADGYDQLLPERGRWVEPAVQEQIAASDEPAPAVDEAPAKTSRSRASE